MEHNELRHYGIKGMKWGVRRYQKKDGTLTSAGKKRYADDDLSEDYKKAHSSKNIKSMSDAELRSRLNRLQMEQQYSKLNPGIVSKGRQTVNALLKAGTTMSTATTTAITIYNNADKIQKILKKA